MFLFYFSKPLSGIHKAAEGNFLICVLQICDCKKLKIFYDVTIFVISRINVDKCIF